MFNFRQYSNEAVDLLLKLIAIPSFSREESLVADFLVEWMLQHGLSPQRSGNNIWIADEDPDHSKPVILLNSHIDTVKPGENWKSDPFIPLFQNDRITGLGSNDAGASVVSLIQTYRLLKQTRQSYRLVLAITAEEEVSGVNGVCSILDKIGQIDLGIVGEPTQMQMAVAERGLLVMDCFVHGTTGHAARNEGDNAIYKAISAIQWFQNHPFTESKGLLGPVKMTVTMIDAGSQHNVIPDKCHFVVDARINECYSNREVFDKISALVDFEVVARSFRLNSSFIPSSHPVVMKGMQLGLGQFGSPTTSDQALMPFTTLKIGPGDSSRSHTPNEYILTREIEQGISIYYDLLNGLTI